MRAEPATFGGPGWRARAGTHAEDMRAGRGWVPIQADSEWGRLRHVVLYPPGHGVDGISDPDANLFLGPVSSAELRACAAEVAKAYRSLGVHVHQPPDGLVDDARHPNTLFQRDVLWATPFGVVIARMASQVRAGEERYATETVARLGMPVALTVGGDGTFEGADALWLRPDLVLCGVGRRTNWSGYSQVAAWLDQNGVESRPVPVPAGVQHLLGGVQIVSPDRALVRTDIVDPLVVRELRATGYKVVDVPEHPDVACGCAMNFVVVEPDTVVMPAALWFEQWLGNAGVSVATAVDTAAFVTAGGGIACATGILGRDPAGSGEVST